MSFARRTNLRSSVHRNAAHGRTLYKRRRNLPQVNDVLRESRIPCRLNRSRDSLRQVEIRHRSAQIHAFDTHERTGGQPEVLQGRLNNASLRSDDDLRKLLRTDRASLLFEPHHISVIEFFEQLGFSFARFGGDCVVPPRLHRLEARVVELVGFQNFAAVLFAPRDGRRKPCAPLDGVVVAFNCRSFTHRVSRFFREAGRC